jgi:hypothetical protein
MYDVEYGAEIGEIKNMFLNGINTGATIEKKISKNFGLITGLSYSTQGSHIAMEDSYLYQALHFCKLPLGITFNSNSDKLLEFNTKLGVQTNLLVKADNFWYIDEHPFYEENFPDATWEDVVMSGSIPGKKLDNYLNFAEFWGYPETNIKKMYQSYVSAWIELGLGWRLTDKLKLYTNLYLDAGFTDLENKDYQIVIGETWSEEALNEFEGESREVFFWDWIAQDYEEYPDWQKRAYAINAGFKVSLSYTIIK